MLNGLGEGLHLQTEKTFKSVLIQHWRHVKSRILVSLVAPGSSCTSSIPDIHLRMISQLLLNSFCNLQQDKKCGWTHECRQQTTLCNKDLKWHCQFYRCIRLKQLTTKPVRFEKLIRKLPQVTRTLFKAVTNSIAKSSPYLQCPKRQQLTVNVVQT